jgi:hypothetical protein
MNKIDPFGLIIVRMSIATHLSSAGRPTGVSQSQSRNSALVQNLFNNAIDAVDATVSFIRIFDQYSFLEITTVPKDTCTIVASIF